VITRWQAARGYPKSGFFNKLQHKALLTEIVATAPSASSSDEAIALPAAGPPTVEAAANSKPSRGHSLGQASRTTTTAVPIRPVPAASSAAWSAECSARRLDGTNDKAREHPGLFHFIQQSACVGPAQAHDFAKSTSLPPSAAPR
jgi:hypothetical protein